jgi:predicted ribosome quality control (RQC) complex YloA/Tae2 family protein
MRYLKSFNESKLDKPNYKKLDIDGFLVYQGKDAKANDYITFELSSDEDYWFHAKGVPGSHILIKVKEYLQWK